MHRLKLLPLPFFCFYRNPMYTPATKQMSFGVLVWFAFNSSPNNSIAPAEDLAALGCPLSLEAGATQKESPRENRALFPVLPLQYLWVFLNVWHLSYLLPIGESVLHDDAPVICSVPTPAKYPYPHHKWQAASSWLRPPTYRSPVRNWLTCKCWLYMV